MVEGVPTLSPAGWGPGGKGKGEQLEAGQLTAWWRGEWQIMEDHAWTRRAPRPPMAPALTLLVGVVADGDGAIGAALLQAHEQAVDQVGAQLVGALAQEVVKHLPRGRAEASCS